MLEKIVPYREALILRELGFEEKCFGFFNVNGDFRPDFKISKEEVEKLGMKECCLAPTFGQAFTWFRDVHHIDAWVVPYQSLNGKKYGIQSEFTNNFEEDENSDFDTYEEAEIHLIKVLLKVIQKRNHEPEHEG